MDKEAVQALIDGFSSLSKSNERFAKNLEGREKYWAESASVTWQRAAWLLEEALKKETADGQG